MKVFILLKVIYLYNGVAKFIKIFKFNFFVNKQNFISETIYIKKRLKRVNNRK